MGDGCRVSQGGLRGGGRSGSRRRGREEDGRGCHACASATHVTARSRQNGRVHGPIARVIRPTGARIMGSPSLSRTTTVDVCTSPAFSPRVTQTRIHDAQEARRALEGARRHGRDFIRGPRSCFPILRANASGTTGSQSLPGHLRSLPLRRYRRSEVQEAQARGSLAEASSQSEGV